MWMFIRLTTIHLHVKINDKMWTISFMPLSSMGNWKKYCMPKLCTWVLALKYCFKYIDLICSESRRWSDNFATPSRSMSCSMWFLHPFIWFLIFSSVQGKYRNWAKSANVVSKLPATRTLDRDLGEKKLLKQIIPYSDKLLRRVAVEWLVATDQVRNPFYN